MLKDAVFLILILYFLKLDLSFLFFSIVLHHSCLKFAWICHFVIRFKPPSVATDFD